MNIIYFLGGVRATVFACLAVILAVMLGWQIVAKNNAQDKLADWKAADQTAQINLRKWKEARQQELYEAYNKIDSEYQRGVEDGKSQADQLLSDRKSGSVKLRDQFYCKEYKGTVPGAPGSSSLHIEEKRAVLSPKDEEFLVRIAAEADEVVNQLNACLAITEKDRKK